MDIFKIQKSVLDGMIDEIGRDSFEKDISPKGFSMTFEMMEEEEKKKKKEEDDFDEDAFFDEMIGDL